MATSSSGSGGDGYFSERLDTINREIWNFGFNCVNLQSIDNLAKEFIDGFALFERIPQAQQSGLSRGSEVLCAAAIVCRGCPCTESETREIYCTDDLIRDGWQQTRLIEIWSRLTGCWFDEPEIFLNAIAAVCDEGSESLVFFDVSNRLVYKLISLKHYNVLRLALDRIIIHNAVFADSALTVIGFGRMRDGEFVIVVTQEYVEGQGVTESERLAFMMGLGFEEAGEDYGMHLNYRTNQLYIGDLNQFNVLKGRNGGIHVIDADCRLNVATLGCGGDYVIPKVDIDFSAPFYYDNP